MTDRLPNGRFRNDAPRPPRGAGLWGAARGQGSAREDLTLFDAENQPGPEAQAEGKARKAARLERIGEAHDAAMDKLMARIEGDEVEARDLNAIVRDTGNRMWGAPTQPVEHSGEIGRAVVRDRPLTEDEWTDQHDGTA